MDNLTADDVVFFSDELNWRGGPMYEVNLIYPYEYPKESIVEALFKFGELIRWQPDPDLRPRLFRSILTIDQMPSVGFVHGYGDISVETSEYSLAIYPPQFRRVTGFCLEEEGIQEWGWMDANGLAALHERLLLLVRAMSMETPVLGASMCPEGWGGPGQEACRRSICFLRGLAKRLNLKANVLESTPDYVSVDM